MHFKRTIEKNIYHIALLVFGTLFCVFSILGLNNQKAVNASSQEKTPFLSDMTTSECIDFIIDNDVSIPEGFNQSIGLGEFVKTIIKEVESDPTVVFTFNYIETLNFAEDIKNVVNAYYGINETSKNIIAAQNTKNTYELQYNWVRNSNGEWVSSGGEWDDSWLYYNCYAYAIEETPDFSSLSSYGFAYQPGFFCGTSGFYFGCLISDLVEIIRNDLMSLNYDVSISSSEPQSLSNSQSIICVRSCFYDYHFMRKDLTDDYWYHKPGSTSPLKYKYHPSYQKWCSEVSVFGEEKPTSIVYDSDLYYITFGTSPFTLYSFGDYCVITGIKTDATIPNNLQIPDNINGKTVVAIGNNAFAGKTNITNVILPNTITSIGVGAFNGCTSLSTITLPSSITSIGDYAFANATSLTAIRNESLIPQVINDLTFNGVTTADISLFVPPGTTQAYINAGWDDFDIIESTWITSFNGTGVTIDGSYATPTGNIVIPSNINGYPVTAIGDYAFQNCFSITSITIPSGVTSIGNSSFEYCTSLTSITIPSSVTTIGDRAFGYCYSLANFVLPSSLTSIGNSVFVYCVSLTNMDLPSNVIYIGGAAFYGCYNLDYIILRNTNNVLYLANGNMGAFSSDFKIYVPSPLENAYLQSDYWSYYTDNIEMYFMYYGQPHYIGTINTVYSGAQISSWETYNCFGDLNSSGYQGSQYYCANDLYIYRIINNVGYTDYAAYCQLNYNVLSINTPHIFIDVTLHIDIDTAYNGSEVVLAALSNYLPLDDYKVTNGSLNVDITGIFSSSATGFLILPSDNDCYIEFSIQDVTISVTYQALIPIIA